MLLKPSAGGVKNFPFCAYFLTHNCSLPIEYAMGLKMVLQYIYWFVLWIYPSVAQVDSTHLEPSVSTFLKTSTAHRLFFNDTLYNHYYQTPARFPTAIVFLPGMGESAIKYYDLPQSIQKDATFYLWDHIGLGHAFHFVPLESYKVHIDTFETYIKTLISFLEKLEKKHSQIIVIGHSMGGHIALRTLHERPDLVDQLVLSSPMIDFNPTWIPVHFISWLAHFIPASYYPPFYSIFKKISLRGSYTTTSHERIAIYKKTTTLYPEIKRSGATIGWIRAAEDSIEKLKASSLAHLTIPVLLLQAEEDYLVSNSAQNAICTRMPTCTLKPILQSRHELLFETESVRNRTLSLINEFLKN